MIESRRRLSALTGLRFVAVSMVFVLHSLQTPGGWLKLDQGVSFFFVLSGFILTHIYPELPNFAAVKRFYIARLARLWPLHLFMTLLIVGVGGVKSSDALTLNILLLHAWVPIQRIYFSYNPVSWSLSTEVLFCLAFPLLIMSLHGSWLRKLFVSFLSVLALIVASNLVGLPSFSLEGVSAHGLLYINPISRIFEFIAGMCCYLLWRALWPRMPNDGFWALTAVEILAISVTIALIVYPYPFAHSALGSAGTLWIVRTSAMPGFCMIVVVFAFGRGLISRILGSKVFEFLGEISFAVYLLHVTVIVAYRRYLGEVLGVNPLVGFAVTAIITLAAASVTHLLIERPCRSLINAFGKGWRKSEVGLSS